MRRTICAVVVTALGFAVPAVADKPGRGKPKDKGRQGADVQITVTFGHHERDAVNAYFLETYGRGNCPPGLAKKGNGCLPPGQAKKRYVIGRPLPRGLVLGPIPAGLAVRIGPPPRGYRYGIVDGDLLKLAVGTLLVVDAIDGLVN